VPTPFDFILTKNGQAACIDCKTIDSGNFSHSMLTQHQVDSLVNIFDSKIPAGYLVWFRDVDIMSFFTAEKLYHLYRRESLKPGDGIMCGNSKEMSLMPILTLFEAKP
jgi:penicillin-binding protein-related factor A (putative recombinase)